MFTTPLIRRSAVLLVAGMTTTFLLIGCGGSSSQEGDEEVQVPTDFHLVFGEGGGVTGEGHGFTISADGTLQRWRGRSAEENLEPAGSLEPAALQAIWTEVQQAGFFDLDPGEPGNMTRFVRITAEGRTHETQWVPQLGGADPAPAAAKLYQRLQDSLKAIVAG